MLYQLQKRELEKVIPLLQGSFRDPLLYAVLEGRRTGRVLVDDVTEPGFAFVWSGTECAYVGGRESSPELDRALRALIAGEIIPQLQRSGADYLSLFSLPPYHVDWAEALFADWHPLRTPVNTFAFDAETFRARRHPVELPPGLALRRIDHAMLNHPQSETLRGEVAWYWDSVDAFLAQGLGYGITDGDTLASYCFSEAYGDGTLTMYVWTLPERRGQGLATRAGTAFINRCLEQGHAPFWMCDDGNAASRGLAERLGFSYTGDFLLLDIPFHPFAFYRGLAREFYLPNQAYRQAGEMYERAFGVQAGAADDYYDAARTWALAGDAQRAVQRLHDAVTHGWDDVERLETDEAFRELRRADEWHENLATLRRARF
jgi:RimJ/RimL family protein N-acetyltransferase